MSTKRTPPALGRGRKHEDEPTVVIDLRTLEAPARLDLPELGAQEHVDVVAAATRILAAHRAVGGNSSHAAELIGITYSCLRRSIHRFDLPRACSDGISRRVLVRVSDNACVSLDDAIKHMRERPHKAAQEAEGRAHLAQAVGAGIRLVDVARKTRIEQSRLTKFMGKTRPLSPDELEAVRVAVSELLQEPVISRPGRRAA